MEDHRRAVLFHRCHDGGGIAEIDCDHLNAVARGRKVGICTCGPLALCAKNLYAANDEILSEVRPILAADPRNECLTVGHPAIVPSEAPFDDASAVT